MAEEKIFAEGFSFKRQEKAPDFVIGRLSIKVDEAIDFMKKHSKSGWVNLNIKTARTGNHYLDLDTYEPKSAQSSSAPVKKSTPKKNSSQSEELDDVPF